MWRATPKQQQKVHFQPVGTKKEGKKSTGKTEAQTHRVFIPFVRHLNNFQSLCLVRQAQKHTQKSMLKNDENILPMNGVISPTASASSGTLHHMCGAAHSKTGIFHTLGLIANESR